MLKCDEKYGRGIKSWQDVARNQTNEDKNWQAPMTRKVILKKGRGDLTCNAQEIQCISKNENQKSDK